MHRSKSEETFCRPLITMVEETFDIRRSRVDHGRQIMNLKSGYVEGSGEFQMEGEAKENDMLPISDRISGTIRRFLLEDLRDRGGMYGAINS